jgi:hypothetical protein
MPSLASNEKASDASKNKGKGKAKTKGDGGTVKKVGNPGNFHGDRLAFLEGQLPIYLATKGRGEVTIFFSKIFGLWWAKFPWYEGYGADGKPLPKVAKVAGLTALATPTTATSASPTTAASGAAPTAPTVEQDTSGPDANVGAGASAEPWAATGGVNPTLKDKIKAEIIAVRNSCLGLHVASTRLTTICL